MELRKTNISDVNSVMKIISQSQDYFKLKGIDQWQNNYPNENTIIEDINNGYSYVLEKDNKIIATLALSFNGEVTYNKIYQGEWLSNEEYAVIHRIAVDNDLKGNGISSYLIECIKKIALDLNVHSKKVETHEDNISMQRLLEKNDFKYCGIIYLEDGNKRIAFEKLI